MRFTKAIEVNDFLKTAESCEGEVWLESPDGDKFVLKSVFSRYLAKVQDRIRFDARVEERTKEYVLSRSNLTPEEYDAKFRVEWYMFADEAKERGFCDYIIGEDCDLDEVI